MARIAAQEPDCDDTILIEGALHRTSNVAFTLENPFVQYAPFKVGGHCLSQRLAVWGVGVGVGECARIRHLARPVYPALTRVSLGAPLRVLLP